MLVLSLDTDLVSPQFHVQHDDLFETISPKSGNPVVLSHWQELSGLRLDGKPEKTRKNDIVGTNPITKKAGVTPYVSTEPDIFELEDDMPPRVLEEDDPPPLTSSPEVDAAPTFGPTLRHSTRTR
jgi:hypothetical protein